MGNKEVTKIFTIGFALFSMFFGGGNLIFPLWIGSETTSVSSSLYGFLISGVILPFYGIVIALYFGGDYNSYLKACGKRFGALLIFVLFLFWIPLGSAPRCNILGWGALQTAGLSLPLPIFSALYSLLIFILCYRESRVLELLGKLITPILIIALFTVIVTLFSEPISAATSQEFDFTLFSFALFTGYHTQDFIAAIFFSTTIISLVKEKEGKRFNISTVVNACIIALAMLSLTYIGLMFVGFAQADILSGIPKERLLATLGQLALTPLFQWILFIAIFLSALSTSIALTITFADYIRKDLFGDKISHPVALILTILVTYGLSVFGFENLAVVIDSGMIILYPTLVVVTTYALAKSIGHSKKNSDLPLERRHKRGALRISG